MRNRFKKSITVGLCAVMTASTMGVVCQPSVAMAASGVKLDQSTFPDSNLRFGLSEKYDKDGNNVLSDSELKKITTLSLYTSEYGNDSKTEIFGVRNLKGVDKLSYLKELNFTNYDDVSIGKTLDFSKCKNLTSLNISGSGKATTINISGLKKLTNMYVWGSESLTGLTLKDNVAFKKLTVLNSSKFKNFDIKKLPALENIRISESQITSLDVTKNKNLKELNLTYGKLKTLKTSSANSKLSGVYVYSNPLTSLDVSKLKSLSKVSVGDTKINSLNKLKVYKKANIKALTVRGLNLSSIKNHGYNNITFLDCSSNKLTSVPTSSKYETLYCSSNKISSINVSSAKNLKNLAVGYNKLTKLDVSKNPKLKTLSCEENSLTKLDLSKNTELSTVFASNNKIKTLDFAKLKKLEYFYGESKYLENLTLASSKINYVSLSEAPKIKYINLAKCPNADYLYLNKNVNATIQLPSGSFTCYVQKFDPETGDIEYEPKVLSGKVKVRDLINVDFKQTSVALTNVKTNKVFNICVTED